jgi:hypothetical protein
MNRELIAWGIVLLCIIVFASVASCLAGYVLPPLFRTENTTPAPTLGAPTLREMQRVAELATTKYTLSAEVQDARIPQDIRSKLGIKEEILLIAYGEVAAGFDLHKLSDQDLWADGTRVQLHLPAPEILYVRLDNERTHVVYYNKSLFVERDLNLESSARQQAEQIIRQAALESEILAQASEYGELFFTNWLYQMGFTEVRVIVD